MTTRYCDNTAYCRCNDCMQRWFEPVRDKKAVPCECPACGKHHTDIISVHHIKSETAWRNHKYFFVKCKKCREKSRHEFKGMKANRAILNRLALEG